MSLDPGTRIGVEVGPERAVPDRGFAPVVPNADWPPTDHGVPYWCVRRGGLVPRVHRLEHFRVFDPGIPHYRRCDRCGVTVYVRKGKG